MYKDNPHHARTKITLVTHVQSQKIGRPNNLNIESKKSKEPKQDSKNQQLKLPMSPTDEPAKVTYVCDR